MPEYHQAIFDLLGTPPVSSPERLTALEARQQECGVRFPASVQAFYAITDAETLFQEATGDTLVALEELGNPADTAQGWLHVADENQGVVAWFVRLDAGDDPPVVNNNDEWPEDLSTVDWQPDSETWTNFIFDRLAGGQTMGLSLTARDLWPTPALLDRLREKLKEGPQTEAPLINVRRFYDKTRLLVIRLETGDAEAEWKLDAQTPETLADLAHCVWDFGTLAKTLTVSNQASKRSDAVLTALRGETA